MELSVAFTIESVVEFLSKIIQESLKKKKKTSNHWNPVDEKDHGVA